LETGIINSRDLVRDELLRTLHGCARIPLVVFDHESYFVPVNSSVAVDLDHCRLELALDTFAALREVSTLGELLCHRVRSRSPDGGEFYLSW
jgi:hypothetical protein